jgi:uncharacterized protein (DUF58 family)
MARKRLLLLSGLIYILFLLGLATMDGRLLALSIPLVVYVTAALLYGPEKLCLRVTRTLDADRVYEDTPVAISLLITNEGSRLEELLVRDLVPQPLEPCAGSAQMLASLGPGETIEMTYTVNAKRGIYDFQGVQMTGSDQLGLFRRQEVLSTQPAAAPFQLSVLPRAPKLRRVAIRPLRTRGYAGPVPARQGGSGVDFFGVREYWAGDPQRWINWRVSARHPRTLYTNEFEQERIADVGLILDARRRSDVRPRGRHAPVASLFDYAVDATASLAETFLSDGNRVGLLIYGYLLDWTFPGYGKVQRERILQALARAKTGDSQVFENLDNLPTRFFPARSQIVLVSPLCWDDLPMLIRLRARGYQLLVVRPDPTAFEARALEPGGAVELATRLIHVEWMLMLRKLQQAGIRVVDWQVDEPFDQAIHASLGRMPHWFRAAGWS